MKTYEEALAEANAWGIVTVEQTDTDALVEELKRRNVLRGDIVPFVVLPAGDTEPPCTCPDDFIGHLSGCPREAAEPPKPRENQCPDCEGFGFGVIDTTLHRFIAPGNDPCPTCNGSGTTTPKPRRMQASRDAQARVSEFARQGKIHPHAENHAIEHDYFHGTCAGWRCIPVEAEEDTP